MANTGTGSPKYRINTRNTYISIFNTFFGDGGGVGPSPRRAQAGPGYIATLAALDFVGYLGLVLVGSIYVLGMFRV